MKRKSKHTTAAHKRKLLPLRQAAEELDITVELLQDYAMRGCPHVKGGKGKPNQFDVDEVAAWMRDNNLTGDPGRPADTSPDIQAARLRELNLRCRKHEIDVAEREGKLLDSTEVEHGRVARIHVVKSRLMGLPARVAPLAYGQDASQIQSILENEVRTICHEFAA